MIFDEIEKDQSFHWLTISFNQIWNFITQVEVQLLNLLNVEKAVRRFLYLTY